MDNPFKDIDPRIVDKFNEIQLEILRKGWKKVSEEYHPDNNHEHPEAFKLFDLYKQIHENMKKRLYIDKEEIK